MTDWTTKGLFSALVLVGGLGFGRQVVRWWHGEDAEMLASVDPAATPFDFSDPSIPVDVALGDSPFRLVRQTVVGDQTEAMRALRAACRRRLHLASPWSPVAEETERKLLARLAEFEEPAIDAELPAGERLYEPVPDMPLIVGTRRLSSATDNSSAATSSENRMVLWGLAAPVGNEQWTIYVFQAQRRGADDDLETTISMPPDCQRILALGHSGVEVSAFVGNGTCDGYREFFAGWQAKHCPHDEARWRQSSDGGWDGSFVHHGSDGAIRSPKSLVIQLVPGRFGGCTGIVVVSP